MHQGELNHPGGCASSNAAPTPPDPVGPKTPHMQDCIYCIVLLDCLIVGLMLRAVVVALSYAISGARVQHATCMRPPHTMATAGELWSRAIHRQ